MPIPNTCKEIFRTTTPSEATHLPYPFYSPRLFIPIDPTASSIGKNFFFSKQKQFLFNSLQSVTCFFTYSKEFLSIREANWIRDLKERVGFPESKFVYSVGTPGPNSKVVAVLLDKNNCPVLICKLASTNAATKLLKNEWSYLQLLSQKETIKHCVPTPLFSGSFEGIEVITQTICLDNIATQHLGFEQICFLSKLHESSSYEACFSGSCMHRTMLARLDNLRYSLSPTWKARAEKTLDIVLRQLSDKQFQLVTIHGDFVPWNMRNTSQGLYIFDWEYASNGYLPLYDLCHFLLLPAVLNADISKSKFNSLRKELILVSASLPNSFHNLVDIQLLAYMLDLSLLYLNANEGRDSGDLVLARYAKLIDSYNTWRIA